MIAVIAESELENISVDSHYCIFVITIQYKTVLLNAVSSEVTSV